MIDPVDGEVAVIKHRLPLDGEKGLVISAQDVLAGEEAKKTLARSGVIGGKKQMAEIDPETIEPIFLERSSSWSVAA